MTLAIIGLTLSFALPNRPLTAHGANLNKVVCKTVKKHGKKHRTCHTVVPKPTATPAPPPVPFTSQATTLPCAANAKGTGCADLHFSLTSNDNGVTTFSQKELGYTLELSRFGIVQADTSPSTTYYLTMYVKATKSSPKDGALDSWQPSSGMFSVMAANGHPYSASTCRIPPFPGIALYNGEHDEGWVCSNAIPKGYMDTTFTWSVGLSDRFATPYTYSSFTFPLVTITVRPK
jgi:hypothetical protein